MITVVTGPPCSGKTTYVQQHALPGEPRLDFDVLAVALGSPDSHGHGDRIAAIAQAAWHAVLTEILGRPFGNAWIVDTQPSRYRLTRYQKADARMVALTADTAELHRRADEAGRPPSWHARIDQWRAFPDPAPSGRTAW